MWAIFAGQIQVEFGQFNEHETQKRNAGRPLGRPALIASET